MSVEVVIMTDMTEATAEKEKTEVLTRIWNHTEGGKRTTGIVNGIETETEINTEIEIEIETEINIEINTEKGIGKENASQEIRGTEVEKEIGEEIKTGEGKGNETGIE